MPNPMPTYMEEIMVMETMQPMSKLQKKSLDEMKKVLSKGNVLSQKQKQDLDALKQQSSKAMKQYEVREMRRMPQLLMETYEEIPYEEVTAKAEERYQREAKKGEASPKDFSTAKKADPRSAVRPSEADLNDRLEADSQVGLPNVFDLAKKDANAARAMLRTPTPVVR